MRNIAEIRSAGGEALRRTALKAVRGAKAGIAKYEARRPKTINLSRADLRMVEEFVDKAFKKVDELDKQRGVK